MVGGGNIIIPDANGVKKILHEYGDRIYLERVLDKNDNNVTLAKKCLEYLSEQERELLYALCVKGVSERDYAKHIGMTRYRVREEKKRLLELTAKVFRAYFCP